MLKYNEKKKLISGKYLDKERARDLLVFNKFIINFQISNMGKFI